MPYFHKSNKIILLFKEWKTETLSDHIWYAIFVFIIAIVQESLGAYLKYMLKMTREGKIRRCFGLFISSLLYKIIYIVHYVLMFSIMVHSILLFVAVATGSGLGYFLFQPIYSYYTDANKKTCTPKF